MNSDVVESKTHNRLFSGADFGPKAGLMSPALDDDGRIRVPGIASGLSVESYLPLVHLYASTLEARRILDCYGPALRKDPHHNAQAPLTALQPSKILPHLYYKREDQTVIGAYKVRGAVVAMARAMENAGYQHFLAVSTGNHALGVLKAAEHLRPKRVRLVVPESTAPAKLDKISREMARLESAGLKATLTQHGACFDEARAWALAQDEGEYYLGPYSDPWVVAGQGTIGLELFQQVKPLLEEQPYEEVTLIAPVGGGGLLAGTASAFKMAASWDSRFRSVNVNVLGLRLGNLNSVYGDAIKVSQIASGNRMLFSSLGVSLLDIGDTEMALGMAFVQKDMAAVVEGASAATVWPVIGHSTYQPSKTHLVISLLSGGNVSQSVPAAALPSEFTPSGF